MGLRIFVYIILPLFATILTLSATMLGLSATLLQVFSHYLATHQCEEGSHALPPSSEG